MPDVIDRRKSPRFALIVFATITEPDGNKFSARTSDVSKTGCYIDALTPLAKGTSVYVELRQGRERFVTIGTVVYVNKGLGMGIQFHESVLPDQLEILTRWLENAVRLRP
jgi:hypothetical protein